MPRHPGNLFSNMSLQTGQVLHNRYRIVRLLARGGFGAVYRAWDLRLNGPVALKENFSTSPDAQKQFEQEAHILFNLRHPNLPRVIDHFNVPGTGQYLVMDYIEGEDLQTTLDKTRGPLPAAQVLHWIEQICDALTYMHNQAPSVIHRDVKPANIKITPEGRAILVDFGIAKMETPTSRTTVGARAVTLGYSPPEQYGHGHTNPRSDVYALGATTYTLLTGRVPPESVYILNGSMPAPPLVHTLNAHINPSVGHAIAKAMEVTQARRFDSAAAFKAGLHNSSMMSGNWRLWSIGISAVLIFLLCVGFTGWAGWQIFAPTPTFVLSPSSTLGPTSSPTSPPTFTPVASLTPAIVSPTPSLTLTLPPTLIPTPFFFENFSTPEGIWRNDASSSGYENGQLFIFISEGHHFAYELLDGHSYRNATIEVDASMTTTTPGGFGMVVRFRDLTEFYLIRLDSSQFKLEIVEYTYQASETTSPWTALSTVSFVRDEVIKGVGETNHLKVTMQDTEILVWVNGEYVGKMENVHNMEGMIGLYNCTCGGDGTANAYFDNLTITTP